MTFRRRYRLLAWMLAMTGPAALPQGVAADPMVRVRAASRLSASLHAAGEVHELRGWLADDLDQPLPDRRVTISLSRSGTAKQQLPLTTDAEGRFAARLGALEGVDVSASFGGDALHTGTDVSVEVGSADADVQLLWSIEAGKTFDLGTERHNLELSVVPADAARSVRLSLHTDFAQLGRAVADASGRARFSFAASLLGPARRTELVVEAAASDTRAALHESRTVIIRSPTALTLHATSTDVSGEVRVSGQLYAGGRPVPQRAVTLVTDHGRLATLQTDAQGHFDATVPVPRQAAPAGQLEVYARFESDAPWRGGSRSPTVRVSLPLQRTPHAAWLLVPALLSLALLLHYRPRDNARDDAKAVAAASPAEPGFQAGSERRISWAGELRISGRIVDLEHGDGLQRASLQLVGGPDAPMDLAVDAGGGFASPELAPGEYTVHASAPGYCPEHARFEVPHRGQWTHFQVTLERLRNRAFEEYRPAGDALGPIVGAAAILTPREILDGRRAEGTEPQALAELVQRVEGAVYGATAPDAGEVDEIRRRSAALKTESGVDGSDRRDGGGKRATIPHQR